MGFRDAIRGGGGFLNNVDGAITGYEFTNKNVKGEKGKWIYFVPTIQQDGASDEVTQHFFMGDDEQYDVSKDGQTITSEDGVTVGKTVPFTLLIDSMIENGFDESTLPDLAGGDDLELSVLVGQRFRFVQVVDEKATKDLGKRKGTGKHKGKEFNRTNTIVSKCYGAVDAPAKGKAGKAAPAGKKGKQTEEDDLTTEAQDVLKDLLDGVKDNTLPYSKLSMALTKKLMKNDNGEAIRKKILDEDFLGTEEGWSYDSKKEVVSLDA